MKYIITYGTEPVIASTVLANLLEIEHTDFLQKLDDCVRLPHSILDENLEQTESGTVFLNQTAFIYVINHIEMDFMKTINFPNAEIHAEFNQFDKQAISTITAQTPLTVEEAKLVTEINLLNDQSIQHRNLSLIYAAKTGAKLIEAKEIVGHGNFLFWLNQHCTITRQHANNYMNLARSYPELLNENNDINVKSNLHLLDVTKAIALMTAPEEVKENVMLRLENGETVTVKDINKLKKECTQAKEDLSNTLESYQKLSKEHEQLQEEILENQNQLIEAEHHAESIQAELDEKEKELDSLIKEGGVDKLVKQKTAETQQIIAEMQQQQDALTDKITSLNQDIDKKVQQKLDIERMKHKQEFDQLEHKTQLAKSELETVQTQLEQSKNLHSFNENVLSFVKGITNLAIKTELELSIIEQKEINDHDTAQRLDDLASVLHQLATRIQLYAVNSQQKITNKLNADLEQASKSTKPKRNPLCWGIDAKTNRRCRQNAVEIVRNDGAELCSHHLAEFNQNGGDGYFTFYK